jgi:hypothetical protein
MKINKEWIILALIIFALILYLVLREQDRVHYTLPDIPEISQDEISRVEISKLEEGFVIEKRNNNWIISPQGYPADSFLVESMLESVKKPFITAMVSDSKNYTRYGLDEDKRITVRLFSEDVLKREIQLGATTDSGRYTFIKLPGDHRVYHARDNLRNEFKKDIDELRDKTVLSFTKQDIREMEITKDSNSLVLVLTEQVQTEEDADDETRTIWQTSEGKEVEESLPEDLLSSLFRLSCREYLYDTGKEDLKNPLYTIRLKGIKEYTLSMFSGIDDDQACKATSSENDYVFILSDWQVDKIIEAADKILKYPEGS